MEDFSKLNNQAKKWASGTRTDLRQKLRSLGVKGTGRLIKSVKSSVGKSYGVADKIRFSFEKHGVFVEKGVGRGWPISRVGTAIKGGRVAKPWFNQTMEEKIPELAKEMEIEISEQAMKAIKIN